jgi:hypothetical protein
LGKGLRRQYKRERIDKLETCIAWPSRQEEGRNKRKKDE